MSIHGRPCSKGSTGNFKQKLLPGPALPGEDRILLRWRLDEPSRLSSALSALEQGAGIAERSAWQRPPDLTRGSFLDKLGELWVACCPFRSSFLLLIRDLVWCLDQ